MTSNLNCFFLENSEQLGIDPSCLGPAELPGWAGLASLCTKVDRLTQEGLIGAV